MGQDVGCDAAAGMACFSWLIRWSQDKVVVSTSTYVHQEELVELFMDDLRNPLCCQPKFRPSWS